MVHVGPVDVVMMLFENGKVEKMDPAAVTHSVPEAKRHRGRSRRQDNRPAVEPPRVVAVESSNARPVMEIANCPKVTLTNKGGIVMVEIQCSANSLVI